jgi:hypothetical protein
MRKLVVLATDQVVVRPAGNGGLLASTVWGEALAWVGAARDGGQGGARTGHIGALHHAVRWSVVEREVDCARGVYGLAFVDRESGTLLAAERGSLYRFQLPEVVLGNVTWPAFAGIDRDELRIAGCALTGAVVDEADVVQAFASVIARSSGDDESAVPRRPLLRRAVVLTPSLRRAG